MKRLIYLVAFLNALKVVIKHDLSNWLNVLAFGSSVLLIVLMAVVVWQDQKGH